MNTKRTQLPLHASLLALALSACAGGGSDPDGLRSAPAAVTPEQAAEAPAPAPAGEAAPAPTAVRAEAAPAVEDWRPWVEAEVDRLRAERPDHFDAVMGLSARPTRASFLRMTGPLVRDPDSAPILIHRLLSGGEPADVRAAIVDALPRTTGDYSAALADLMELETDARVRELIAASLHRAQAPYAHTGLARGLSDVNARVRAEAVRTLGRRSDGDVLATEVIAALTDPDEQVAIEAARALGNLQVDAAKDALVARLRSDSAALRRHSLRALSRIDAEYAKALPQLTALRSDPDPKVARVAEKIATGS